MKSILCLLFCVSLLQAQASKPKLVPVAVSPPGTTSTVKTAVPESEEVKKLRQEFEYMKVEIEYYKSQLAYVTQENALSNQYNIREIRQATDKAYAVLTQKCLDLLGELKPSPNGLVCVSKDKK